MDFTNKYNIKFYLDKCDIYTFVPKHYLWCYCILKSCSH